MYACKYAHTHASYTHTCVAKDGDNTQGHITHAYAYTHVARKVTKGNTEYTLNSLYAYWAGQSD